MVIKNKKAVSAVIATVSLILITIVGTIILASVIIPYVRDNATKGQSCLQVIGEITFDLDNTCYDGMDTKVAVRFGNVEIDEIYISKTVEGVSTSERFSDTTNPDLPAPGGGVRVYTFDNQEATQVEVGAITDGETCRVSDSVKIENC